VIGLQTIGAVQGSAPETHSPLWHCSTPVQNWPSSHPATPGPSGRFGLWHPVIGSHESGPVHGLPSLQLSAVPGVGLHTPLVQEPMPVQTLLSWSHSTPFGFTSTTHLAVGASQRGVVHELGLVHVSCRQRASQS
jgi:hypothetical protein